MIFHRLGCGVVCLLFFIPMIWWGFFKLPFHFIAFRMFGLKDSGRFVYRYMKALDCAACAGSLGGKSDETISNKAGQMWRDKGFHAPWWTLIVKKITERWEPGHIENSIEPTRDEPL